MINAQTFVASPVLWLSLFPITYLIHIGEEYFGGEGFSAYQERVRGVDLSRASFLVMNSVALLLMISGIPFSMRLGFPQLLLAVYGTVVTINGLSHTVNGLISTKYNPGLVSGFLIWLPLGAFTIFKLVEIMPHGRCLGGIAIGVGIHAVVTILALTGGKSLAFFTRYSGLKRG